MIDFVHLVLTRKIPEDSFEWMVWKKKEWDDGGITFEYHCRSVVLRYYPAKWLLTIKGKLIQLLHDSQVKNLDDIYGNDTEAFMADLNRKMELLLPKAGIDIRDFEVKRIDYCFNIHTTYVSEYLELLNNAFERLGHRGRVNHTRLHGLRGSAYIKTLGDYKENTLRNYVLNYYDKADQLLKQHNKKVRVTTEDMAWSQEILRLEVQCGFQFLKCFCQKMGVHRVFGDLCSCRFAYQAHKDIYGRVFGCNEEQDFYTYAAAKRRLNETGSKAAQTLLAVSRHQNVAAQEFSYGRKMLKQKGIYPFGLLPRTSAVEVLDNPLKLIRKKLESIGVEL